MPMPKMGPDPFGWADTYNRQMTNAGLQGEQNAQNTLMSVFQQEAARQRPWSDLPTEFARQNNASANAFNNRIASAEYKKSNLPPPPVNKITDMIYKTAKGMGVDPVLALAIADIETGGRFSPTAKNPTSSAYGLYQQIDNNWSQYGRGLDRSNPEHQTQAGLRYMSDVINAIEGAGATASPGLVYFGYQQGPGAVAKALRNPNAPVEQVLGRDAARLNGARPGQTMSSFMQKWVSEGNRRYERHKAVRTRPTNDGADKKQFVFGDKVIELGQTDNTTDDAEDDWDGAS